jgi:hypothetical protein
MKRFHVHITVENLPESIQFYSALFSSPPTVQKDDYAKWMLDDPRVNFAISNRSSEFGLDHLGIQVESNDELNNMQSVLSALQSDLQKEEAACCYAKSEKYWVTDPQGIAWETFHTLGSIPVFGKEKPVNSTESTCCAPLATKQKSDSSCCVPPSNKPASSGKCY